jgi:prepilin-type N-terminal cleavage/methylation domain-containing protein
MKILHNKRGYTIIEMLIALFITGVIAAAAFEFYVSMHNQTLAQEDISDMQQNARVTVAEITKSLRMAGYKINDTLPAFEVNGDSLYVFYSETQPVDSVLYFLMDYPEGSLTRFTDGLAPKMLMKKVNSNAPEVFSEFISDITFTVVDSSSVEVAVEVITSRPDEDHRDNSGFRTIAADENVNIRNRSLRL